MRPIAHIRNAFPTKFGVPRQSGLVPECTSTIVLEEEFRVREALRGIEDFSHLWLIWGFHQAERDTWSPTVRPPRLGGNERVGVFATRSPFRPNPIGLTVVKLLRVEGCDLIVSGADMVDGTPIYDIKPYLPYVDSVPEASDGFTSRTREHRLTVHCDDGILANVPEEHRAALLGILAQDPRPGYQHDETRVYGLPYAGVDVKFTVQGDVLTVTDIVKED